MSLDEVADIYLPLSRLLNLYVGATQNLASRDRTFLGSESPRVPFVIGVAGSVAVGKSTASRLLQALLSRWPSHPKVDLITTDGFLLPLADARGARPHPSQRLSRELRRATSGAFMAEVKSGVPEVQAPVYSHLRYDIVPGEVPGRPTPRHRDRRGAERAADGERSRRDGRCRSSCRTFSTSRSTSTLQRERHRAVVHRAVSEAARDGVPEPLVVFPSIRAR